MHPKQHALQSQPTVSQSLYYAVKRGYVDIKPNIAQVCARASAPLVGRMEAHATAMRAERIQLTTTETARAFYLALGYVPDDEPGDIFGNDENVLVKPLENGPNRL